MDIIKLVGSVVKNALWAVVVITAIIAIGCMSCYLFGCQQASVTERYASPPPCPAPADGSQPTAPPGKVVERKTIHTRILTWAGPSPGETIAQMQALEVTDDGAKFSGMRPFDLAKVGPSIVIYAGIALAVIGLGLAVFLPAARTAGFGAGGLGAALIFAGLACESYPWLALAIVGLAVVGGIAWFVFGTAAGARTRAALTAVVAGVAQTERTNPQAAETVKQNIATAASGAGQLTAVKATITETKKKV